MKNKLFKTGSLMMMAAYLFFPGGVQGQNAEKKQKFHIVMVSDENGEKTRLDTTFNTEAELEAFMQSSGVGMKIHDHDRNAKTYTLSTSDGESDGETVVIEHIKIKEELEQAEKELNRSREELKGSEKELQEALKKLHEMNIEIEDEDGIKKIEMIIDGADNGMNWIPKDLDGTIDITNICDDLKNNFILADNANSEVMVFIKKTSEGETDLLQFDDFTEIESVESTDPGSASESQILNYRIPESNVSVYPNPTNGIVTLKFEPVNDESVDVKILDSRGRTIVTDSFTAMGSVTKEYQLKNFTKGTYLMQIRQGDHWKHEKIVLR